MYWADACRSYERFRGVTHHHLTAEVLVISPLGLHHRRVNSEKDNKAEFSVKILEDRFQFVILGLDFGENCEKVNCSITKQC